MGSWVHNRLEITEMTPKSQSLAMKFCVLNSTQIAQAQVASTFLVLFLLEVISFTELGILFAIQFGLMALLDYPTGALGDAIGHKMVLAFAYCCYAISIIFLLIGNSFVEFVIYAALTALGGSQESGALQSWFDNNYRITMGDNDKDRKIFGAFSGKMQVLARIISGSMFIGGGIIAAAHSRRILFIGQLCLVLIALGFIVLLMNNEESIEIPQRTLKAYIDRLKGGLQFVASTRGTLLYFLCTAAFFATISIWGGLMLLPFYESYAGGDEYIGLLRAIIYASGIFWQLLGARMSKRVDNIHRGQFLTTLMLQIVFYSLVFGFYNLFPPPNAFVLASFVGVIILFQFISLSIGLESIFRRRLLIELVPDKYRNSVYSLMPTLQLLFSVPMIILGGFVITQYGFTGGLLLIISMGVFIVPGLGLALYWLSRPKIDDIALFTDIEASLNDVPARMIG
ncbi:MAG: MFS transporter [Candidatus Hodarchaeales archaeon]